jgi:hypothetical protein
LTRQALTAAGALIIISGRNVRLEVTRQRGYLCHSWQ